MKRTRQLGRAIEITAAIEFKLADCWMGLYWEKKGGSLHVWVCVLPCFPLHLMFRREAMR